MTQDLATYAHDANAMRAKLADMADDEAGALYSLSPRSDAFERREHALSVLLEAVEALDRAASFLSIARDL